MLTWRAWFLHFLWKFNEFFRFIRFLFFSEKVYIIRYLFHKKLNFILCVLTKIRINVKLEILVDMYTTVWPAFLSFWNGSFPKSNHQWVQEREVVIFHESTYPLKHRATVDWSRNERLTWNNLSDSCSRPFVLNAMWRVALSVVVEVT